MIEKLFSHFAKKCHYCEELFETEQKKIYAHYTVGIFGTIYPKDFMHEECWCKYCNISYVDDYLSGKKSPSMGDSEVRNLARLSNTI